jgi:hypothetical protein
MSEKAYAKAQKKKLLEERLRQESEALQRQTAREGPAAYQNGYGIIHTVAFTGVDADEQQKFRQALDNGPAGKQGQVGIKKLSGQSNMYELKILGASGGARLYGDQRGDGLIHFTRYAGKH